MIWHNGRLYLFDGWAKRKDGTSMQRIGNYPGYVRLIDFAEHNELILRADRVMVGGEMF